MAFHFELDHKFGPFNPSDGRDGVEPKFGDFQLLGDSILVRFADQILQQRSIFVNGAKTIGLCVSGQRICQLRKKIKTNTYPVTKNVMLLIGTNDVLCGSDIRTMIKHFNKLLKTIKKTSDQVLILTLPPIPRLCVTYYHWTLIRKYNFYLRSLCNNKDIIVVDICHLFTKFQGVFLYNIDYKIDAAISSVKKKTNIMETLQDTSTGEQKSTNLSAENTKNRLSSPRLFLKCLEDATGHGFIKKFNEKTKSANNSWSVIEESDTSVNRSTEISFWEENWDTDNTSAIQKCNVEDSDRWSKSSNSQIQIVNNVHNLKKRESHVSVDGDNYNNETEQEDPRLSFSSSEKSVENQLKFHPQMRGYIDYNFLDFLKNHNLDQPHNDNDSDGDRVKKNQFDFNRQHFTAEQSTLSSPVSDVSRKSWPLKSPHQESLSHVDKKIIEMSKHICHVEYYEHFFNYNCTRLDMVHLNYKGLDKLKNYLLDNRFIPW